MSKSPTILKEPEIALFQATDTGEEPNAPADNNARFNGWKVIRSGSHRLGQWKSSTEDHVSQEDWVCGMEAMQQMISAGEWDTGQGYRNSPGEASIVHIGYHTTPWHIEQITTAHENGYRVGVLVPADPEIRARINKLHDAGVPVIDVYDDMDEIALESLVREFAYSG